MRVLVADCKLFQYTPLGFKVHDKYIQAFGVGLKTNGIGDETISFSG
jgi:hypothetical protein